MENIQVSIIIPHKNIPDLLNRCLDSIPERDNLEIIIIDDCSDNIDKTVFPGLNKPNTTVIFSDKSITAGGARNLGLEKARGKWLLFADADDFFHPNFYDVISSYFNENFDLIYFGIDSVHSDTFEKKERIIGHAEALLLAESGSNNAKESIRYSFLYPSAKLISRKLVFDNNIVFDEVVASNDVMFSMNVAKLSKLVDYRSDVIYCLTYREGSLVRSFDAEKLLSRLKVSFRQYDLLASIGKQQYSQNILAHWWKLRLAGYKYLLSTIPLMIRKYKINAFVKDIKTISKNRIRKVVG